MISPNFSFKYNEKTYDFSHFENNRLCIDDTMTVSVEIKEYKEYNAIEWLLYFENNSDKCSGILSEIRDCDTVYDLQEVPTKKSGYMPKPGDIFVKSMTGMVDGLHYSDNDKESAMEYQFNDLYLHNGRTRKIENIWGRSSEGMMPFFTLEYKNRGFISTIGWTGSWRAEFLRNDNIVSVKSGLQNTKFYLKSGEKIRTSSTLIMEYSESDDRFNKFRRLIRNHYSHFSNTKTDREGLMAFELWGGLNSEKMIDRLHELKKHDVKFEEAWIDAGWYGQCKNCDDSASGDWSSFTGEWDINSRVHPNGLIDVKNAANEAGMNMMFWIEPERSATNVPVFQEHPEWFLSIPNYDNHLLYYGNEEALLYAFDVISNYVEKLDLSCYRQDFNTWPKMFFDKNEEENRIGILEIKHTMGLYKLFDMLLEKYPKLVIDNCASGGRRFDIEMMKRSIPFFRSDYQCGFNENPEVIQTHNAGVSNYLPFNGCTSKSRDIYALRSSYSSSWGGAYYSAIFQSMSEEDFRIAKKASDEYLRIRHYFTMDFYNHASKVFDDTSWAIWQYHDYVNDSGIVMAFRRSNSPFDNVEIQLKGLSENGEYKFESFDDNEFSVNDGALRMYLHEKRSCMILEYKNVADNNKK